MSFDTQEYIELFYQDAEEHIQLMTDALLDLEKNPADKEALGAVFRAAHTMKSSSAMVGFMHVSKFTHKMEDLIGHYRDNDVEMNSETVSLLFQAFDVLKDMLAQLQDEATEAQRNETNKQAGILTETFQHLLSGEASEVQVESRADVRIHLDEEIRTRVEEQRLAGERIYEITVRFQPEAQMTATRAFLVFNNLNQVGTVLKTAPDVNDENEEFGLDFAILVSSTQPEKELKKEAMVGDVDQIEFRDVTECEQFEWNEAESPQGQPEPQKEEDSASQAAKPTEEKVATSFDRREDRIKTQTVRVNIDKLDRLLNLTAEMVIHRGRAVELGQQLVGIHGVSGSEEELLETITQQGMILSQLQETIMEARMVPIGMVFTRFRRLVRDLAQSRGKKVNLVIEGEETELDKKIIDQLGDPLTHMIRNSMDHGLEPEEERVAQGKPPEGLLILNASHHGNNIVISVRDDGRGIDPERLRQKAIEKNLMPTDEAKALSERECINLLFRAGFSTAKEVTDISGRGVGMDVVRRAIEQLGGTVEIQTEIGKGTTFYLKVPLTLAIIQALLVESKKELYALPISSVSETIRIHKSDIYSVKGQGKVFRLRDKIIPLLNLRSVVTGGDSEQEENERIYVAVIRNGQLDVGLIVDRMVNEQEVVIKSLDGEVTKASYVAGASILGDGRVILILDTASLIETTLGSAA